MKKLGLLFLLFGTLLFAEKNSHYEMIETRIENEAQIQNIVKLSGYDIDYDIEISGDQMNFIIELEGRKEPNINYSKLIKSILKLVKENTSEIKEIYMVIKFDPMIGQDKILYTETIFFK